MGILPLVGFDLHIKFNLIDGSGMVKDLTMGLWVLGAHSMPWTTVDSVYF